MTGDQVASPVPVQRSVQALRFAPPDAAPALDRLADLARRLFAASSAEVRLLPTGDPAATDRGASPCDDLCAHVGTTPLVIADATAEPRWTAVPSVADGQVV